MPARTRRGRTSESVPFGGFCVAVMATADRRKGGRNNCLELTQTLLGRVRYPAQKGSGKAVKMGRRKRGDPPLTKLQGVREELGRTQEQVVRYFLARREQIHGLPQATEHALYIMLSRWENGHVSVTEPGYRRMFREFYGRTNEELGFP